MVFPLPPPGMSPPPGLEFERILDDSMLFPAFANPALLNMCASNFDRTRATPLSSKATPFHSKFDKPRKEGRSSGNKKRLQNTSSKYTAPEDDGPAQGVEDQADECKLAGASENLQQALAQLSGALAEWEPFMPKSGDKQDAEFNTCELHQTLAHIKGSLAEWGPSMPKREEQTTELDISAGYLQETLSQLKGALAEWEPSMTNSDEQDDCSSKSGSTKSGSSKRSSKSKSSSNSSKSSSNSSKSKTNSDATTPVMDTFACHSEFNLNPTAMWGPQYLPPWVNDPQVAWHCGWPATGAKPWPDEHLSMPVSIADALDKDSRDSTYDLKKVDPSFILMVRKIFRLGLESASWLKAYFSKYGVVDKVLVHRSRSRANSPGCMGFVVMSTAADVQAILRAGSEHVINGVCIQVKSYQRKTNEDASEEAPTAEMAFQ